jgi:hypothetical protein
MHARLTGGSLMEPWIAAGLSGGRQRCYVSFYTKLQMKHVCDLMWAFDDSIVYIQSDVLHASKRLLGCSRKARLSDAYPNRNASRGWGHQDRVPAIVTSQHHSPQRFLLSHILDFEDD